jgi:hypothetical protein
MKFLKWVILCGILAGCSTGIPVDKYNNLPAHPDSFMLCHGYSCTYKSKAGFSNKEWKNILAVFRKKPAKDSAAERSKIGKAIAMMERYSGAKTGTDDDDAEAVAIKRNGKQLDCIDETVNTTMYIGLLQKADVLKFHEIADPTHRGYLIDGRWPHNTAVIRETGNGKLFVADSFYRKNGEEPYIMPREAWLAGWKPAGSKQ